MRPAWASSMWTFGRSKKPDLPPHPLACPPGNFSRIFPTHPRKMKPWAYVQARLHFYIVGFNELGVLKIHHVFKRLTPQAERSRS